MKYIGYILSVLASAAALSVSAADSLRVKPKHIAPPRQHSIGLPLRGCRCRERPTAFLTDCTWLE